MGKKKKPSEAKPKVSIPRKQNKAALDVGRPLLSGSELALDPELITKVSTILRIGSYIEVAAAINGIGYSTLRMWILKAREHPDSLYGQFARAVEKAISDAEIRDLATIDQHANGRDAVYEYEVVMEPTLDKEGNPVFGMDMKPLMRPLKDPNGNPIMQIARDPDGKPIIKRSEIKPQWQAAAWKLERRNPTRWGRFDRLEVDGVLKAEAPKGTEDKNTITVDQYNRKLERVKQLIQDEAELGDAEDS